MAPQQLILSLVLATMVFAVALELKPDDFRRVAQSPKAVIAGLISQFILLPVGTKFLEKNPIVWRVTARLAAVEGAELVTVRVANIGQVHRPHGVVPRSRRVFDRDAAIRNRRVVEFTHLLGRFALEADGAAVGMGRRLAVDRLADTKGVAFVPVEEPGVPGARLVPHRLARPKRAEHGVVETLGPLDVV